MSQLEQGQGDDLVVVYRAPNEFVATCIKDLLEGESVPVVLESKQVTWLDGTMKMGEGYWGDVVVPRRHAEQAIKLIDEYKRISHIGDESEG